MAYAENVGGGGGGPRQTSSRHPCRSASLGYSRHHSRHRLLQEHEKRPLSALQCKRCWRELNDVAEKMEAQERSAPALSQVGKMADDLHKTTGPPANEN